MSYRRFLHSQRDEVICLLYAAVVPPFVQRRARWGLGYCLKETGSKSCCLLGISAVVCAL